MLLVSIPEAAYETRLSQDGIRRAIARGELPHVRIGRRLLIRREDLEAFIEARRRPAPTTREATANA